MLLSLCWANHLSNKQCVRLQKLCYRSLRTKGPRLSKQQQADGNFSLLPFSNSSWFSRHHKHQGKRKPDPTFLQWFHWSSSPSLNILGKSHVCFFVVMPPKLWTTRNKWLKFSWLHRLYAQHFVKSISIFKNITCTLTWENKVQINDINTAFSTSIFPSHKIYNHFLWPY